MLLAVTGMQREAKLLHGRCEIVVAGNDNSTLASKIEAAIDHGARAVLSFGICGALAPQLGVGDLVIGTEVVSGSERWRTDDAWTLALAATGAAATGSVLGADSILLTQESKASFHQQTAAFAADMESHIVAQVASERGLPFAVLRAVSDVACHALPPAAAFGLRKDGSVDYSAVLLSLLDEPSQIGAVIRTGRDTTVALGALDRCLARLGPRLGFQGAIQGGRPI